MGGWVGCGGVGVGVGWWVGEWCGWVGGRCGSGARGEGEMGSRVGEWVWGGRKVERNRNDEQFKWQKAAIRTAKVGNAYAESRLARYENSITLTILKNRSTSESRIRCFPKTEGLVHVAGRTDVSRRLQKKVYIASDEISRAYIWEK